MEVAIHAPLIAVRVSNDPIRHILFFIVAPAHNIDRVIQRLMSHFHILFSLCDCVQFIFGLLWDRLDAFLNKFVARFDLQKLLACILGLSLLSVVGRVVFFRLSNFLYHNTRLVNLKIVIRLELSGHRAIVENFFSDLQLSGVEIIAINIIAIGESGMWLAFRKVRALDAFRFGRVRSTFLSWNATLLGEESIKDGPATATAFGHIVAGHNELNRQVRLFNIFVGVFHFHSALDCLDKAVGVARAAGALVSDIASEVIAINISQVEIGWNCVVGNMIRSSIFISEFLSFCSRHTEFLGLFTKLFRAR